MDVEQENQPEREADARLMQPSFTILSISSSPPRPPLVKTSKKGRRS